MNEQIKEAQFDQAVKLAAAFVANGDIRLGGSTRPDSDAVAMLSDLISTLYAQLGVARYAAGLDT